MQCTGLFRRQLHTFLLLSLLVRVCILAIERLACCSARLRSMQTLIYPFCNQKKRKKAKRRLSPQHVVYVTKPRSPPPSSEHAAPQTGITRCCCALRGILTASNLREMHIQHVRSNLRLLHIACINFPTQYKLDISHATNTTQQLRDLRMYGFPAIVAKKQMGHEQPPPPPRARTAMQSHYCTKREKSTSIVGGRRTTTQTIGHAQIHIIRHSFVDRKLYAPTYIPALSLSPSPSLP